MTISLSEIDLIKKYRALDERGKEAVDIIVSQPETSVIVVVKPEKAVC